MRKPFYLLQISLLALLVICACDETDHDSYCPTWKGFTYTTGSYPNYQTGNPRNVVLNPGDSIHITAHQDKRGHLINSTDYSWTINFDTLDTEGNRQPASLSYDFHTNYDGYADGADDPVGHLFLPANALPTEASKTYSILFVARYIYSGQGVIVENGNIVDNSSYGGRITIQSGATGGGASGSLFFTVVE